MRAEHIQASVIVLQSLLDPLDLRMIMRIQKMRSMPYRSRYLLALFVLAGSFLFQANHLAYAHTLSSSESAEFLSLVDQIKAETALVTMNLENNDATLAQAHTEKVSSLLNNSTLDETREVNNRIADSLKTGLEQLEENVISLSTASQVQQIPEDRIQSINDTVVSLNDLLGEAVSARVESEQRNNATIWAMVLADLTNTLLSYYGNATGAGFDLTDMANLAEIEEDPRSAIEGVNNNNNIMQVNTTASNATTTTNTIIVDEAAYQTAQYLANNTLLQLFNDMLKPLTTTSTGANDTAGGGTVQQQIDSNTLSTSDNNATAGIEELETSLLQLRDYVNSKASPRELMTIPHLQIHPMLMQLYGLTLEDEEE
jgi:hypothetical protein